MQITKFSYQPPDSDGDTRFAVHASLTNATREVVDLLQHSMVFYDRNGLPIAFNESEHECSIDPGETYESEDDHCGFVRAGLFQDEMETARVELTTRLCRLDFYRGSEVPVPSQHLEATGSNEVCRVGDVLEVSAISVWLTNPDSDGDFRLCSNVLLRNLRSDTLPKVVVKLRLRDRHGRDVDDSEASITLAPNAFGMADPSFWDAKGKKLRGARVYHEIAVYSQAGTLFAERSGSSLASDDDYEDAPEEDDDDLIPVATAIYPDPPGTIENSIGMKLVPIPPGEFLMGSPADCPIGDPDEEFQHLVRITKPFSMGMHQVTQAQYEHVTGQNPSHFKGAERPVEHLSWDEAQRFCDLLSALPAEQAAGRRYRLPTEAEWEYACRAGTTTPFHTGDSLTTNEARFAHTSRGSAKPTTPVGTYPPNAWGLFDMHGNAWDWTGDWFDAEYFHDSPANDPQGPPLGSHHTLRGGSASVEANECRTTIRGEAQHDRPGGTSGQRYAFYGDFGVRVVCETT